MYLWMGHLCSYEIVQAPSLVQDMALVDKGMKGALESSARCSDGLTQPN